MSAPFLPTSSRDLRAFPTIFPAPCFTIPESPFVVQDCDSGATTSRRFEDKLNEVKQTIRDATGRGVDFCV